MPACAREGYRFSRVKNNSSGIITRAYAGLMSVTGCLLGGDGGRDQSGCRKGAKVGKTDGLGQ